MSMGACKANNIVLNVTPHQSLRRGSEAMSDRIIANLRECGS